MGESLDAVLLSDMDAYWRAANYLSLGQMYLLSNPLLREPLRPEHVKPRATVDWGATSVENFIYVHLNRVIKEHDLNMCYLAGTAPGAPALLANAYLEGTHSELDPDISHDEEGLRRLFRQFSCPDGISSQCAPAAPGPHDGRCLGRCWWCVPRAAGTVPRCWTGSRLRGRSGHARGLFPRLTAILRNSPCSKRGCAATGPRSSSIETEGFHSDLAGLAPRGERRMGMNPRTVVGAGLMDRR